MAYPNTPSRGPRPQQQPPYIQPGPAPQPNVPAPDYSSNDPGRPIREALRGKSPPWIDPSAPPYPPPRKMAPLKKTSQSRKDPPALAPRPVQPGQSRSGLEVYRRGSEALAEAQARANADLLAQQQSLPPQTYGRILPQTGRGEAERGMYATADPRAYQAQDENLYHLGDEGFSRVIPVSGVRSVVCLLACLVLRSWELVRMKHQFAQSSSCISSVTSILQSAQSHCGICTLCPQDMRVYRQPFLDSSLLLRTSSSNRVKSLKLNEYSTTHLTPRTRCTQHLQGLFRSTMPPIQQKKKKSSGQGQSGYPKTQPGSSFTGQSSSQQPAPSNQNIPPGGVSGNPAQPPLPRLKIRPQKAIKVYECEGEDDAVTKVTTYDYSKRKESIQTQKFEPTSQGNDPSLTVTVTTEDDAVQEEHYYPKGRPRQKLEPVDVTGRPIPRPRRNPKRVIEDNLKEGTRKQTPYWQGQPVPKDTDEEQGESSFGVRRGVPQTRVDVGEPEDYDPDPGFYGDDSWDYQQLRR
ncbi:hypothetical protein M409DRAFT_53943 [Zasmidium cellare ATCC 36951]|uniref:Uncharacterized protein n=1 Tax=Zasmidium cellare ATCC 36951 TaxID=1080233 RepID=A0A6A6CPE9_ZASCE|nr:uncharacterized protein M409DRAFT_53943 [Zasmidium cellare ATCC 36951]KAF2167336.1 hypothetical protein M409DRAFT_53943 [Zasmidium cellare ATCC 36951]